MADEINNTEELNEQSPTLAEVSVNLSELLTNSVNMAEKFYEIFFDFNPHYVELQMYDKDGNLITHLVPNRAMDKSIAISGEGTPEGSVEGYIGALYIDVITRNLYIKKVDGGTTGWACITPKAISVWTEEFTFDPENATYVKISKFIRYPEHLMVFANGEILIPPPDIISDDESTSHDYDYSLGADRHTLYIYKELPNNSTIFIRYLDGLDGLKGDTALRVSVKETITLNPEEPADVVEELVDIAGEGNGQNVQLTFKIPRGVTGNSGVHIGDTEPTDEKQNVWIETSAGRASEADFAGMRIWDSNICTSSRGYNKVYDLKHSGFSKTQLDFVGNLTVLRDGATTGFVDNSSENYIKVPYKIGNLTGKSWYIAGKCKITDFVSGEIPILLIGDTDREYGALYARTFGLVFSARTGNSEDNDIVHDNRGEKIRIPYSLENNSDTFSYNLSYNQEYGLYTLGIYDEDDTLIQKANWQAPTVIIKNGERVDMHSRDLIALYTAGDTNIIIGAHPSNSTSLNRHNANDIYYMKDFSFYVENNGVFESALSTNSVGTDLLYFPNGRIEEITYYISNTGSRIADMSYKQLLDEYYYQTGQGNYYLIDELTRSFELPRPDLYGLIEHTYNLIKKNACSFGMFQYSDTAIANDSWQLSDGSWHDAVDYTPLVKWVKENGVVVAQIADVTSVMDDKFIYCTATKQYRLPLHPKQITEENNLYWYVGEILNSIDTIIEKSRVDNITTYAFVMSDGSEKIFKVKDGADGKDGKNGTNGADGKDGINGVGIASIDKISTSGLVDTYQITLTNGSKSTFEVTNGTGFSYEDLGTITVEIPDKE